MGAVGRRIGVGGVERGIGVGGVERGIGVGRWTGVGRLGRYRSGWDGEKV